MNRLLNPASPPTSECFALAVVTVTFHPHLDLLAAQLNGLPAEALKVIVDNSANERVRSALRRLLTGVPRSLLLENAHNRGLAAAINQGVVRAQQEAPECRFLLFLDQDSEPEPSSVALLLDWYGRLQAAGGNPGCVGPLLMDVTTGLAHGFHRVEGWRWVRHYPARNAAPLSCDNLNCSGTLVSTELFLRLGGFEEALFVDHLDTEWAFRVKAAGYCLYGIPAARFRHRMGESSWRVWLGVWRLWPYRSPQRHYLLFRNAVRLLRRDYVPTIWKVWAVPKLALTALVHGVFDPKRGAQLRCMLRGVIVGWSDRVEVAPPSRRIQ